MQRLWLPRRSRWCSPRAEHARKRSRVVTPAQGHALPSAAVMLHRPASSSNSACDAAVCSESEASAQHGQRQSGLLLRQCALLLLVLTRKGVSVRLSCHASAGDIGFNHYGPRHPMKPIRLDMTHHLIVGYGLHKHMEVYVRPRARIQAPYVGLESQSLGLMQGHTDVHKLAGHTCPALWSTSTGPAQTLGSGAWSSHAACMCTCCRRMSAGTPFSPGQSKAQQGRNPL